MTTATETKARAKVIFAATYNYPAVPFRSIGRKCFASCLRRARAEMEAAAKAAAVPAAAKAAHAAALARELATVEYIDNTAAMIARRAAITAELSRLSA